MEDCKPRPISIHNFSEKICDKAVHFHVMSLHDCFLLWVGLSPSLCNLAMAMCSRFTDSTYIYTLTGGAKKGLSEMAALKHYFPLSVSAEQHQIQRWDKDSVPLSSLILGDKSDPTCSSFAQRLAKKTNKQVFVSISIPTNDSQLLLLIEKRIKQEMEACPEKF